MGEGGARRESVRDKLRVHLSGSWGGEAQGGGLATYRGKLLVWGHKSVAAGRVRGVAVGEG